MQHEFLVNVEPQAVLAFALQELEARPLGFEFWVGALGHYLGSLIHALMNLVTSKFGLSLANSKARALMMLALSLCSRIALAMAMKCFLVMVQVSGK
jgi:hypothetical protein